MASSWTRTIGIGNYGSQLRVTLSVVRQDRSANTSRIRVVIEVYNGSRSRSYNLGQGAEVSVTGNGLSHTERITFSAPGRSWYEFASWQFTVPHASDGTLALNIVGRLADTGTSSFGNGGGVRLKGSASPLYLAPTTPTWGSTTYESASRVRVSWNNRATARGAYSKIRVQRWARSTGDWFHRALLSGSATSYTDTALSMNNEHRWRVRAEGPGGTSGWVYGGYLPTEPAAATNVKATKKGQSIRVTWTDNAAMTNSPRTVYIDDNQDGKGWVRVGQIGGSPTSWTHSDADPAVTHQYRLWTRVTKQIDLTSDKSDPSNVVQLQAAPNQPSRRAPSDTATVEVGDTLSLRWEHHPVDTTEQTAAEVQWRLDGGSWTTVPVTGGSDTVDVTPVPSTPRARFEWRVRTKGDHPDWSPWSSTNGPLLSTRPLVLIQSPEYGTALVVSRLDAAWTYEAGGEAAQLQQTAWKASLSLYDTGTVIETASGSTEDTVSMETRLQNGTVYAVTVEVRNGDGLWSEPDASVFTTDFPLPAVVETFPVWDQAAGAVSIGFGESEALRATYRWTGEPGASTSEAVQDGAVVATNLVTHPLGPTATTGAGWSTSTGDALAVVEDEDRHVLFFSESEGTSAYTDPDDRYSPPVGTVVRFSVDVKVTETVDGMRVRIPQYAGAAVDGGNSGLVLQTPEDGWVRHEAVGTITAMPDGGYVRTMIWPGNESVPAGAGFYIRNALVTYDTDDVPYFDGDTPGTTDVDGIDVERQQPDGSWLLIASGIPTSTTITDRTPQIGDVTYRSISRTVLPTEQEGPPATAVWVHDRDPVFVNGGDGMDTVCLARGADASDEHGVDQALHRFAGQASPTAFFGHGQSHSTSFTGRILPHYHLPTSGRGEWVALLRERGVVCFRDCTGRKVFGVLSVSFSQTGNVEQVKIDVEEATYDEAVRRLTDTELRAQLDEEVEA